MAMEISVGEGIPSAPDTGDGVLERVLPYAGPIGSIISGVSSFFSGRRQERFQERMANTQYQRAAKDLEAAGLNRVLALGGGAAAPSGSSFQMPDLGSAFTSAASASQGIKESRAKEAGSKTSERIARESFVTEKDILWEQYRQSLEATEQAKAATSSARSQAIADGAEATKQSKLKSFYEGLTPAEAALLEAGNAIGSATSAFVPAAKAVGNWLKGASSSAKQAAPARYKGSAKFYGKEYAR